MAIKVTFHGACGIVTGSCFELRTDRAAVLIDCGMFQGTKSVKQLNYGAFPYSPASINALLLTHAHVDHCGLIPKLVNAGFIGPVIATRPTADLLSYVLPDSGYVQETEVERLNRRNRRRGRPQVEPIYTRADAERCLRYVTSKPLGKWFDPAPGIRARFWDAGHILGAASIELEVADATSASDRPLRLLFSGDVGTGENVLQKSPEAPSEMDYVFVESTYGDRRREVHGITQRRAALRNEVKQGLDAGGVVLIPAFAVERTQQLLADLDNLIDCGQLPPVPIFVDSPLATKATEVFSKYLGLNKKVAAAAPFTRSNLRFIQDAEFSQRLDRINSNAIIIAGSGMCDAGRIRHHLKSRLFNPATTVLLVGYQAPGTLGRLLSDKVSMVRIHGEEIAVNARIRALEGYSGHADQKELTKWIQKRMPVHCGLFLVHGEEGARVTMTQVLENAGVSPKLIRRPSLGETVSLTHNGAKTEKIMAPIDVASSAQADWHNGYAETILDFRRSLDEAKSDAERQSIIKRLREALPLRTSRPARRSSAASRHASNS